jgi:hypothetical protein
VQVAQVAVVASAQRLAVRLHHLAKATQVVPVASIRAAIAVQVVVVVPALWVQLVPTTRRAMAALAFRLQLVGQLLSTVAEAAAAVTLTQPRVQRVVTAVAVQVRTPAMRSPALQVLPIPEAAAAVRVLDTTAAQVVLASSSFPILVLKGQPVASSRPQAATRSTRS